MERCVYLNQASLGLVPRRSTEAMVEFLVDVAQYGNVRLSDAAEERILNDVREAAAGLFEAPLRSVAVVGGASEALASGARRFELSTIAYSSAAGLSTSIELLTGVGVPALARHAEALARELVAATAPHGWTPYRDLDAPGASHHIVSLRHRTLSAPAVQARLAEERNIVVSSRGGGIRVSLHAYNDSSDIDALADAMEDASR